MIDLNAFIALDREIRRDPAGAAAVARALDPERSRAICAARDAARDAAYQAALDAGRGYYAACDAGEAAGDAAADRVRQEWEAAQ